MKQIRLKIFEEQEIEDVSGMGVKLKKISVPGGDCSKFMIRYRVVNLRTHGELIKPIICSIGPMQRNLSVLELNRSIEIPKDSLFFLGIEPSQDPEFRGEAVIEYEIFHPFRVTISGADRHNTHRIALVNIARFLEIKNWDTESNENLYRSVTTSKSESAKAITPLLNKYFKAYEDWFLFCQKKKYEEEVTGGPVALSVREREELVGLKTNRDKKREELQVEFDRIQFEEFKRRNGLQDITGTIVESED